MEQANNKSGKLMFGFILFAILLIMLVGVAYAFFNYTRTGSANVIKTGKIAFNTEQGNAINLTNMFPIDVSEGIPDDNTKVGSVTIHVTGDTTYTEGIEYLVSVVNVQNTVGTKKLPISIDVSYTANGTGKTIGVEDNDYFTNRGTSAATSIYHVYAKDNIESDGDLIVGYIKAGETGIDGNIVIKAFLDNELVAISDTYNGDETDNMGTTTEWVADRTVFTTTEWNALQSSGVSFKVKVEAQEGTWVEGPLTLYNQVTRNVITPANPINFANVSSSTNGEGLYILPGTESDTNPIYYYRGAVNNNNVIFGGFCWQMVRTTETGGIKMIYNGLPDISGSGDNITYNCGTTRDIQDTIRTTTSLSSSTGYYYADDYEIVSTSGNSVTYRLKSKTNPITQVAIADATAAATAIPTIATNYPYTCKKTTDTATCINLYKVDSYASGTNANVYSSIDRPIIGRSAFNTDYQSVSNVGYMSNAIYPYSSSGWTTNALFGSSATWVNDHYELTDATVTSPNATHHYSCNQTTSDATCTSVRYCYYESGFVNTYYYYITLTGGDTVEDALYKMTGTGSQATKAKNSAYNLNVNNSTAKTAIDTWFRTNLTNEENVSNPNYSTYLEDTVYCNDRSFKTLAGNTSFPTYTQNGWNPNGGGLTAELYFGTHNRYRNNWYSTSNVPAVKNTGEIPNIACPNETDRFTVSNTNGNGALTYPVGLLTADEIILAGVGGNNASSDYYYINTGDEYWSLSPYGFNGYDASGFRVGNTGGLDYDLLDNSFGLRPVISLKTGIEFDTGGDGTGTNPYVVKYN